MKWYPRMAPILFSGEFVSFIGSVLPMGVGPHRPAMIVAARRYANTCREAWTTVRQSSRLSPETPAPTRKDRRPMADQPIADIIEIEQYVMDQEGVAHVSSTIGQGALRFLLTYTPEKANPAYAQLQVEVEDLVGETSATRVAAFSVVPAPGRAP